MRTLMSMRVEKHWVEEGPATVVVDWIWDKRIPMQVCVVFGNGIWKFSRDLLIVGMEQADGLGCVRVEPIGQSKILLTMHGDDGTAEYLLEREDVQEFLVQTLVTVPPTEADEKLMVDWEERYQALKAGEIPSIEAA